MCPAADNKTPTEKAISSPSSRQETCLELTLQKVPEADCDRVGKGLSLNRAHDPLIPLCSSLFPLCSLSVPSLFDWNLFWVAPRIHAASKAVRQWFYDIYSAFVRDFRDAAEKLRAGDLKAPFPRGCFPPALPFVGG